jgi:hypothetical protein
MTAEYPTGCKDFLSATISFTVCCLGIHHIVTHVLVRNNILTRSHGDTEKKQLLTYLHLSGRKVGYLMNFDEALMMDGISLIMNVNLK